MTEISRVTRELLAERGIAEAELVEAVARHEGIEIDREGAEKVQAGEVVLNEWAFPFVLVAERVMQLEEAERQRLLWALHNDTARWIDEGRTSPSL